MAVNRKLLQGAAGAAGGLVPSEHFGVVLYEGDGSSSHSINGGKFGAAFYGNGSDSRIDVSSIGGFPSGNAPRSISFWMYSDSYADGGVIAYGNAATNQGFAFYISSSQMIMTFYAVNANINYSLSVDTWYHVVATFDGTTFKAYFNGSQQYSDTRTLDTLNTGFRIGGVPWNNSSEFFNGKLDQVRIFTKALSSSEVSTLYAETASTVESLSPLGNETVDTLQVLGDTSCIALYKFENNEDDESTNYDLTGNAIQYAAGRYGQAASFNGSSSYAQITSSAPQDSSGVMSVSFWAKTTSTSRACFFIAEGPSSAREFLKLENYGYQGTNSFRVSYNNSLLANIDNVAISDGNWHHIVITAGGGNVKTYKDNSLLATQSVTITDQTLDHFAIGYRKYNNDLYFNGEIDQLRIFNKEISAAEVTTLYNENSLVASYRFEGNANDDTRNYDGTASNVTYEYGLGFTPDFVWCKTRSATGDHNLTDSTRGVQKGLNPNTTAVEGNQAPLGVTSFDTGGFTVSDNSGGGASVNGTGQDYVAWCLKANGGTTSSNTDGTNTSTVQVNSDAGFSIVQGTSSGGYPTVNSFGHGLGVTPAMIIIKQTNGIAGWPVWHQSFSNTAQDYLSLNLTDAKSTSQYVWGNSAPTSSVFSITDGWTLNVGGTFIAYCFAEVEGFSKFGSYTGNGSTDGPIVETGFEPAFLILRKVTGDRWFMLDNKRSPINPRDAFLDAQDTHVESVLGVTGGVNFLSNGFQIKATDSGVNGSGLEYIFMAFAADPDTEQPTVAKSFSTVAWTGDGSTGRQISTGFQPSLVWTKGRNNSSWAHFLQDSVRGAENFIKSNTTDAEATTLPNIVSSFNDDGFVIENNGNSNTNGDTYVAWAWKADDNEPTILPNTELSSLISKYKFNDNVDDDYGDNNASPSNLSFVTGKFKKAADFNGSSSKITYPQVSPFNDSNTILAISAWVKLDSASDEFVIMSASSTSDQNVSVQLIVGGNKAGRVFISNAANNQQEIQANFGSTNNTNWNHYVWQLSSSNGIELWFNGVSQTRTQTYQAGSINTGSWFGDLTYPTDVNYATGINRVVTTAYYNGAIDQMRLFNAELTSSEISSLYNEANEALVSANANAGFSIVKYEGNSTAGRKVPHGLSAVPQMIIVKRLESPNDNWAVYNETIGNTKRLALDETGAAASNRLEWNSTTPSATTFTLGNHSAVNTNSSYIAYCFHSVAGYSKIGSYTGTGSTGNVINVGFQPDFIILKNTSSGTNGDGWFIFDTVRSGNPINVNLQAQQADAESGPYAYTITISSSGFEPTGSFANFTGTNASGNTYIYMAFKIN